MFADFLRRLTGPDAQRLPQPDASLALAALLVRIARTDGDYAPAEKSRIDRVLALREGLTPEAAQALRTQAEALEAEAPDTVRFTRAIKEAVPLDHRVSIVEAMWEVALADGRHDNAEDNAMRLIVDLLGVPDVESGLARQRVAERRGGVSRG